jgi:hypothetical protein
MSAAPRHAAASAARPPGSVAERPAGASDAAGALAGGAGGEVDVRLGDVDAQVERLGH